MTTTINFTHITTADGLSSNYVRDIYQDNKGFIWVCTVDGLNRYDGYGFTVFKNIPGNKNSLPGNDITSIQEDHSGNYWIGTNSGLCYFDPEKNSFSNFFPDEDNKNSLGSLSIGLVLIDDLDNVWLGLRSGLQIYDPKTKTFETHAFATEQELRQDADANVIYQFFVDHKKQLWVKSGWDLFKVDMKLHTHVKMLSGHENNLGSIYQDDDGQYWLSYWNKGLAQYDGIHPPAQNDFISAKDAFFRLMDWRDPEGKKWFLMSSRDGLFMFNKENHSIVVNKQTQLAYNGFNAHACEKIIKDKENNIWITTDNGIEIIEKNKQYFKQHYTNQDMPGVNFYNSGIPKSVVRDGNNLWFGLWATFGLQVVDSNWNTIKRIPRFPSNSTHEEATTIYNIYQGDTDIFWISTNQGLVKYNKKTNSNKLFFPKDIHPDIFEFRKILPLASGKFIIRTRFSGLYIFNPKNETFDDHIYLNSKIPHHYPENETTDFAFDLKGRLWVTTAKGIQVLDTSSWQVFDSYESNDPENTRLPYGHCSCLDRDTKGNIWIGTQHGLCVWSDAEGKFTTYTTQHGLCNNFISALIVDKNDAVWMCTQNGLAVFNQEEKIFTNFYKDDGLPQNAISGWLYEDVDGTIWITDPGVIISANPDSIPLNQTIPGIIITQALVRDSFYEIQYNTSSEKFLETNYKNNSIQVNFANLNYRSPQRNSYYYTLQGLETTWHQSDRGIATYNSLPPNHYILRVKGSNNSNVMNETGDFINIIITPEWYQTQALRISAILLSSALLAYLIRAVYRYRIQQLQKLIILRNKISKDLHDDIGSTLTSISFDSSAAGEMTPDQWIQIKSILQHIGQNARNAMENMSDIVWAVNPVNETFKNVLERLEIFSRKLLDSRNITLEISIPDNIKSLKLNIEQRKNLYLILREAIHNVAKYSQATFCRVSAYEKNKVIEIQVQDNGIGFNLEEIKPGLGGNGLVNMQQRAEEINTSFSIDSEKGKGTSITLQFQYP